MTAINVFIQLARFWDSWSCDFDLWLFYFDSTLLQSLKMVWSSFH